MGCAAGETRLRPTWQDNRNPRRDCLPQTPDNLERGVGLAGGRGHRQQDAVLTACHGLDHSVDGVELVVPGRFARGGGVVVLRHDASGLFAESLPCAKAPPQLVGARELVELQLRLDLAGLARAVTEKKASAIRGKGERHAQHLGVLQRPLVCWNHLWTEEPKLR